jgi:hypothetical protein
MSSAMPTVIRDQLRAKLWAQADQLRWSQINDADRAVWYQNWSKDPEIGGQLAHFMDPRKVRVYIKDSLLKAYHRSRSPYSESDIFQALNLQITRPPKTDVQEAGRMASFRQQGDLLGE